MEYNIWNVHIGDIIEFRVKDSEYETSIATVCYTLSCGVGVHQHSGIIKYEDIISIRSVNSDWPNCRIWMSKDFKRGDTVTYYIDENYRTGTVKDILSDSLSVEEENRYISFKDILCISSLSTRYGNTVKMLLGNPKQTQSLNDMMI